MEADLRDLRVAPEEEEMAAAFDEPGGIGLLVRVEVGVVAMEEAWIVPRSGSRSESPVFGARLPLGPEANKCPRDGDVPKVEVYEAIDETVVQGVLALVQLFVADVPADDNE